MKYIIRLDDVCPEMDWEKFKEVTHLLEAFGVTAVCGVIPCNQSTEFYGKRYEKRFIKEMNKLKEKGWEFAQHGHNHVLGQGGGHMELNKRGEFPGLSFNEQCDKIAEGKRQMNEWGLDMQYFYAPAHAYDQNTYRALEDCYFEVVLDGIALKPWKKNGLTFVPQVLWQGRKLPFSGITVICLHPHLMQDDDFGKLYNFLGWNCGEVVSVRYALCEYRNRKRSIIDKIFKVLFYIRLWLKGV